MYRLHRTRHIWTWHIFYPSIIPWSFRIRKHTSKIQNQPMRIYDLQSVVHLIVWYPILTGFSSVYGSVRIHRKCKNKIYSDLWYSVRKCYSTISVHLHICILNELDNMRYNPPQHLLDHQLWSFIFTTKPFQDSSVYHECNIYHICIYLSIALYISWYITGGITLIVSFVSIDLYGNICTVIYISVVQHLS